MLSREDHAGIFGNSSSLKAGVIRDANEFARSKGKIAIPVSVREKPVGLTPADWATFEYQFKIVDANSPIISQSALNDSRKVLPVRANYSVQHTSNLTADVNVIESTIKKDGFSNDKYSELTRLHGLMKNGIISEDEFEILKNNILFKKETK